MKPTDTSMSINQDTDAEQVAAWVGNLAGHAEAVNAITALGEAAIPGLRAYLARGPEIVPQARCFAVAMLARLHGEAATDALRDVLRGHPLHGLSPQLAESEYVVKNAAMDALATRPYPRLKDDVAFGIGERLRTAVAAAGRLRQGDTADVMVALLDDDVLAETAVDSLATLGAPAVAAITVWLDAWLVEMDLSVRRRLAIVRALRVLRVLHGEIPTKTVEHALQAASPAVRAAASLLVWPQCRDENIRDNLLHGALGRDWGLADACRDALQPPGPQMLEAAQAALQRDAEPDMYGDLHPLGTEQKDWLTRFIRACTVR